MKLIKINKKKITMKNFITLLFITLTFNCFSQTVLVYDRINDFESFDEKRRFSISIESPA